METPPLRGANITQESLFSTVHLNTFVPADHPLRAVRELLNEARGRLDGLFNRAYAPYGKESIAPDPRRATTASGLELDPNA